MYVMRLGQHCICCVRVIGAVAFTLCLIAVGTKLLVAPNLGSNEAGEALRRPAPVVRMRGAGIVLKSKGNRLWEMDADSIEVSQDRRTTTMDGLKNGRLYKGGKPVVTLTAARAVYDSQTRALRVFGGVTATTASGLILTTDVVEWSEKSRRLICPGKVVVRTKEATITGDWLEADLDVQRYT
ncbi:MAG: LPS export ABC transporter periplasmic protein LptC, partial [Armatimonadota bacterium]